MTDESPNIEERLERLENVVLALSLNFIKLRDGQDGIDDFEKEFKEKLNEFKK